MFIFDEIFAENGLDEIDLGAMFLATFGEDELEDFDEYWDNHYNKNKVEKNERNKCSI